MGSKRKEQAVGTVLLRYQEKVEVGTSRGLGDQGKPAAFWDLKY